MKSFNLSSVSIQKSLIKIKEGSSLYFIIKTDFPTIVIQVDEGIGIDLILQ